MLTDFDGVGCGGVGDHWIGIRTVPSYDILNQIVPSQTFSSHVGHAEGDLYIDDGKSNDYTTGRYISSKISMDGSSIHKW